MVLMSGLAPLTVTLVRLTPQISQTYLCTGMLRWQEGEGGRKWVSGRRERGVWEEEGGEGVSVGGRE